MDTSTNHISQNSTFCVVCCPVLVIMSCFSVRLAGWLPWQCHMIYMWSPMAPVCTPITFSTPSPIVPSLSTLTLVQRWVRGKVREREREREEWWEGGGEKVVLVYYISLIPRPVLSLSHVVWVWGCIYIYIYIEREREREREKLEVYGNNITLIIACTVFISLRRTR